MSASKTLSERCTGRWRGLLPSFGVSDRILDGKHHPCPVCRDGKDRFRFADAKGLGTWYCNQCGDTAKSGYGGTGIDLVMRMKGVDFHGARELLMPLIDTAPVILPRSGDLNRAQEQAMGLWKSGEKLTGDDPASRYLRSRGIILDEYPAMLRWIASAPYTHAPRKRSYHPAMLALYVGQNTDERTLHVTYLTDDGRKADLEPARKMAPGKVPRGGSVRLAPSAETMGVAEGIETALSAMLIHGVPVWAALNAGALLNWEPPATARNVLVFGDSDTSFTGQNAAYALAHRLKRSGRNVEVRLPDLTCGGPKGADWNDVMLGGGA